MEIWLPPRTDGKLNLSYESCDASL